MYGAAVIGLIAVLLPTALRPPQPPPPTSAEFSPDAPPDEDAEVILAELARGTSATAGAGQDVGGSGPPVEVPLPTLRPSKGTCLGAPARQTESLYAPPCAPAWTGSDNGGATHRGVTATEVRIGLVLDDDNGFQGPIPPQAWTGESDELRTYRIYQAYYNQRFELYGRQIRFYVGNTDRSGSGSARAAVTKLDTEYKVLGIITTSPVAEHESIRRKLITYGGFQNNQEHFVESAPYAYSFKIDGSKLVALSAEMLCRQLWGKPASFAGDPIFNGKARKFGAAVYDDPTHYGYFQHFQREFAKCGGKVDEVGFYNLDLGDKGDDGLQIMTKFKAAAVSTVLCLCDGFAPIIATHQATQQGYFPEWVGTGGALIDSNYAAQFYEQSQWRNSIGVSSLEMERPLHYLDWYRAYKEIDPNNEPEGEQHFYEMLQFVGAIQMAGPTLNPDTFQKALWRKWPSRPPDPVWSIGGGYGPGDFTYPDYVSVIWWDPTAPAPNSQRPGAYRHVHGGKRYALGEFPSDPIPFFDPNGAPNTPADPNP